jgi:hypothetical protein
MILSAIAACGDNLPAPDHAPIDAPSRPDAAADAPLPDAAPLVRVQGNVDYNGPLAGAKVEIFGIPGAFTNTDGDGNFYFDVPIGSRLVVVASMPTQPELVPMIRGVVVADRLRPRVFYMVHTSDLAGLAALGVSFDPQQAIAQIDFRNASIGGYGAALTHNGTVVAPGFGIAFDNAGPQVSQITVAGGDGSTLTLGNIPPQDVTFSAVVPAGATLPCQARDANPLPLRAGMITWFDFECGNGQD